MRDIDTRIADGSLPNSLVGCDYRLFSGKQFISADPYTQFVKMIHGIMWVRCQGFWRDADTEVWPGDTGD